MVTGDLNMALVQWIVQYRIDDPKAYLFRVRPWDQTIRDASESAMREVVGDRTVDEVLTIGRQEIENETLVRIQEPNQVMRDRRPLGVRRCRRANPHAAIDLPRVRTDNLRVKALRER